MTTRQLTEDEIAERMQTMLDLAPVNFESLVDEMSNADRGELERYLDGLIGKAALAAGYIGSRYGGGCGDQGHDDAVKAANKLRRQCRKAIGFNETRDIRF